MDEILSFCDVNAVDIMTFSETWLDDSVTDLEVCPSDSNFTEIEIAGVVVLLY